MKIVAILIPALNPLSPLYDYVKALQESYPVYIVNDGSDLKYNALFEKLGLLENCTVIWQEKNLGKGSAIKQGIHYILNEAKLIKGIATAGAHGQHSLEDVKKIIDHSDLFSDGIILGVRTFERGDIPFLHQLQNKATLAVFELLYRKKLLDMQTGLRFLPYSSLNWLKNVAGEQYDFDTNMLIEAIRRNVPIYEIAIGEGRIRKNSLIQYDEVLYSKKIIPLLWSTFLHSRFKF